MELDDASRSGAAARPDAPPTDAAQGEPSYGITPPGFRLPATTRLGEVRLQVSDIEQSIAYYEQVLGLRVVARGAGGDKAADVRGHRADETPEAILAAHGDDAPIIALRERRGARPVPRRGRLGLFHFAILLPDRPALGRFVSHLGEIGAHAGMSDHFVSEAIYLYDPDGLGIEVYADRPRSRWRTDGRQLYMTTEPLDVRSLVAAAEGERWTGMPAGTVMGHVHLHVGDIDAAAAFYHEAVGFDKVVWTYPGALFMSAGGYHHHLGTNTWAAGAAPATDDDARLLDWRIIVPDEGTVAAVAESLTRSGHAAEREGSGLRARDPWGTAVRITT